MPFAENGMAPDRRSARISYILLPQDKEPLDKLI